MTAKEYLEGFDALRKDAEEAGERLKKLAATYRAQQGQAEESEEKLQELTDMLIEKTRRCIGMEIEIRARLEELKPEERALLAYKYIDGLSWEEIGDRMHMSERTVYYKRNRALRRFRTPDVCIQLQETKT